MRRLKFWAFSGFFLPAILLLLFPPRAASTTVENGAMEWAYGWVVDSITVSGNRKTKSFVILREMETRAGGVLNRETLARDSRYLGDLGLFASIEIDADSLSLGHCALRIKVIERSFLFLNMIVPLVDYDWEKKGFSLGVKLDSRNFRGRNESLGASYKRDANNNDHVSFGWSAPWLGWRHIGLGLGVNYFNRSDVPRSRSILARHGVRSWIAVPLTQSRISLAQIVGSLTVERLQVGRLGNEDEDDRVFLSPLIGLRLDSRDSRLKPMHGRYFYIALIATRSITGERQLFYRLFNDLRFFRAVSQRSVIGLLSNLLFQFGEYPDYSTVRIGGSGTLRGYSDGRFVGYHRWFQSVEWRFAVVPRKVFQLPILGYVDVGLYGVAFVDGGIVWEREEEFQAKRFHSSFGFGLRLYSPYQDVIRLDLGFNRQGSIYPYLSTGIRF